MGSLLIYALLTPALFYLGSRATVTSWLWSRYPSKLAKFMDCAACSGAWYGVLVSTVLRLPYDGVYGEADECPTWAIPIVIGLCSMVWTPIIGGIMQAGFERLGTTVEDDGANE